MSGPTWGTADAPNPTGDESVMMVVHVRRGERTMMVGVAVSEEMFAGDHVEGIQRLLGEVVDEMVKHDITDGGEFRVSVEEV